MGEKVLSHDGLYVYEATHRITYNTKKLVPIGDVIIALQGLRGLLETVPALASGLTGVEIERSAFNLQTIESGSLIEEVLVQFFFKDRASLDAFIAKLGGNKAVKGTVIAALLAGVAGYGLSVAITPKQGPSITATNNVIIISGAGELKITPEMFEAAIAVAAAGNKKEVAQSALKFITPARADSSSSIAIGSVEGGKPLRIEPGAIAESPKKLDLPKNEGFEELKKVEVLIRATDLDSKKTGWAGRIEGKTERVKVELDPTVSEAEMFGKTTVIADATLIFEPRGKGSKLTPTKLFIRKIY